MGGAFSTSTERPAGGPHSPSRLAVEHGRSSSVATDMQSRRGFSVFVFADSDRKREPSGAMFPSRSGLRVCMCAQTISCLPRADADNLLSLDALVDYMDASGRKQVDKMQASSFVPTWLVLSSFQKMP